MDTDKQKLFKRAAMAIEREIEASEQMLNCSYIQKAKKKLHRLLQIIHRLGWEDDFDEYVMTWQHLM